MCDHYVFHFVDNVQTQPDQRCYGPISATEFTRVRFKWVKDVQNDVYKKEIASLKLVIKQLKTGPLKGAPGGPIKGSLNTCLKDRYTLIEQSQYSSEEQCTVEPPLSGPLLSRHLHCLDNPNWSCGLYFVDHNEVWFR